MTVFTVVGYEIGRNNVPRLGTVMITSERGVQFLPCNDSKYQIELSLDSHDYLIQCK